MLVQCCFSHYKKDMDLLDQMQQRATNMINGLEHLSQNEAERAVIAQPEEKAQGILEV